MYLEIWIWQNVIGEAKSILAEKFKISHFCYAGMEALNQFEQN